MSLKLSVFCLLAIVVCGGAQAAADPAESNVINSINDLDSEKSVYLFGGLSIEKNDEPISGPRSVSQDDVVQRAVQYMDSHRIQFTMPENEIEGSCVYVFANITSDSKLFVEEKLVKIKNLTSKLKEYTNLT